MHGGLTEWLRSSPGKRVRLEGPVGSSPMSSAKIIEQSRFLVYNYTGICFFHG